MKRLIPVLLMGFVSVTTWAYGESIECSDSTGNLQYSYWFDSDCGGAVIGREAWTLKSRILRAATMYSNGETVVSGVLSAKFVTDSAVYVGDNQTAQVALFTTTDGSPLPVGVKPKMVMLCRSSDPS